MVGLGEGVIKGKHSQLFLVLCSFIREMDFTEYKLKVDLEDADIREVCQLCVCGNTGLAVSYTDCTVKFFRAQSAEFIASGAAPFKVLEGHCAGPLYWIPPNEQFPEGGIATQGTDNLHLLVWDLRSEQSVETLKDPLLSSSQDCSLRLCANYGEQLPKMVFKTSDVHSVDHHASGLTVTGGRDNFARIWEGGLCIQTIEHPDCVWHAQFVRNGDIYTRCADGLIRVWRRYQEKPFVLNGMDILIGKDKKKYGGDVHIWMSKYSSSRRIRPRSLMLEDLSWFEALLPPDYISELPDDVLLKILQKLSLREAVQTRLLSKRWNQISKSRNDIILDWKMMRCTSKVVDCSRDCVKFVRAVDQYLDSLKGLDSNAFMLTFCLKKQWARHIDQWIKIAVGLGIESLFLHFSCINGSRLLSDSDKYVFRAELFQEDSKLDVLSIRTCTLAVGPKLFNLFGSLFKLTLCDLLLPADLVDYLCAHTENLLYLELFLCSFPDDQQLCFTSSGLKELHIICCWGSYTVVVRRCINLVNMFYYGEGSQLSIIDVPCLDLLCIGLDKEIVIPCVPSLSYLRLTQPSSGINLSSSFSYRKLEDLLLEFISLEFEFKPIILLLQQCPSLKSFRMSARCSQKDTEKDLDSEMSSLSHRSLETVKIFGFSNHFNHLQLAKFLLSNCVNLKKLNICPWTSYLKLSEFDLNDDLLFVNKKFQNRSRTHWDEGELGEVCRKLQGFPKHAALRIWFPKYGLMSLQG